MHGQLHQKQTIYVLINRACLKPLRTALETSWWGYDTASNEIRPCFMNTVRKCCRLVVKAAKHSAADKVQNKLSEQWMPQTQTTLELCELHGY